MKKFMVLYYAPIEATMQMAETTPEEQAKGMEGWMTWAQNCGDKLVDMGAPLMNGQEISPGGNGKPSNKDVTGYSILQAANYDEAKSLLKGHPHLDANAACSIELYEMMPLPGM